MRPIPTGVGSVKTPEPVFHALNPEAGQSAEPAAPAEPAPKQTAPAAEKVSDDYFNDIMTLLNSNRNR